MAQPYYITTPIYYVNDKPHVGHAYTTLACDVLARFKRLDGFNVTFLTGTDEHGQKVEKAAFDKGVSPQSFTNEVSQNFRDLTAQMNFQMMILSVLRRCVTNLPVKKFGSVCGNVAIFVLEIMRGDILFARRFHRNRSC